MKDFSDLVAFHGHACGGPALGYKACELAAQKLDLHFSEDEEIVAITETDSCMVDAIQVLLGCTAGKGNLFVHTWGKKNSILVLPPRHQHLHLPRFIRCTTGTGILLFQVLGAGGTDHPADRT